MYRKVINFSSFHTPTNTMACQMSDLSENEKKILKYWENNDILNKANSAAKLKKRFFFLDGPPYANGPLHLGHIRAYTRKDAILRYKMARGFRVSNRSGFDVHGLPIENKVESELKLKSKHEIETKIGVAEFINKCIAMSDWNIQEQVKDAITYGIWLDFKNPYIPSHIGYIDKSWEVFKRIYDKNLVYCGNQVMPYCLHCGTVLAKGPEVEEVDDTDYSIFVLFKITAKKSYHVNLKSNAYFLIWTTTPWTLPANVAIAVNPDERYVMVKIKDIYLIIAKKRLDAVSEILHENVLIESELLGSELAGIEYISPLEDKVPKQKELRRYHKVVTSKEYVTMEEGTGLLHVAPGHGIEDYNIGLANKLPVISVLGPDIPHDNTLGEYAGLNTITGLNDAVLKDLKLKDSLLYSGTANHKYPHCWRCHEKLIYTSTVQWFINIEKIRKSILKKSEKVQWYPKEASNWFTESINSSPDWVISRQRYWGIPIPIWVCDNCNNIRVIGSINEIKSSIMPPDEINMASLHKPFIDKIEFNCDKCKSKMSRIKDVFDVWFDSGVAHTASMNNEEFKQSYGRSLISEGPDQLRGWFATLMKTGIGAYNKSPYSHVVMQGWVVDSKGEAMHKSKGNYITAKDLAQRHSIDSIRLFMLSRISYEVLKVSEDKIKEYELLTLLIKNISKLISDYSEAIHYSLKNAKTLNLKYHADPEDMWIMSRLNTVIRDSTEAMETYEVYKAVNTVISFLTDDFSRFYLKLAKKKILYGKKQNAKLKLNLINHILYKSILLLYPFTPFITEELYLSNYKETESISMVSWPKISPKLIDMQLETEFDVLMSAITAILNSRDKLNLKLRLPITSATIETANEDAKPILAKYSYIIEEYANAKKLVIKDMAKSGTEIRPVFGKLGPDFRENASAVAEAIKSADPVAIEDSIGRSGTYDLHTSKGVFKIGPQHFIAVEKAAEDNHVQFKYGVAYVDPKISEELKEEALVREFERRVQLLRKDLGLKKTQKVEVFYDTGSDTANIVEKNKGRILKIVAAKSLRRGGTDFESAKKHSGMNEQELLNRFVAKEFDIEGERLMLALLSIS